MEEKIREELQKVILKEVEKYTPVAGQTFLADLISFKVEQFVDQELDRAREEGYKKGREDQQHLDGLLYGTTVATTTTLEEGWILKDKKKVEEELSKLTTK